MRRVVYVLLALLAVCCGVPAGSDRVAEAASALEHGDAGRAQACADGIMSDSAVFVSLDAGELCTLARVLVRLTAGSDSESNDASAARCLARARSLDADSVTAFLYSLPGEDAGRLMVLDRVGSYMEIPRDSLVSSEDLAPAGADSIVYVEE